MNEHRQPYTVENSEYPARNGRITLNLRKVIVVILALVVIVELAPPCSSGFWLFPDGFSLCFFWCRS